MPIKVSTTCNFIAKAIKSIFHALMSERGITIKHDINDLLVVAIPRNDLAFINEVKEWVASNNHAYIASLIDGGDFEFFVLPGKNDAFRVLFWLIDVDGHESDVSSLPVKKWIASLHGLLVDGYDNAKGGKRIISFDDGWDAGPILNKLVKLVEGMMKMDGSRREL